MPTNADLKKQLNDMIRGYWTTQALFVAAELDIAGRIADRPKTAVELADEAGANADALYRILRALASIGFFVEDDEGRFGLTTMAEVLGSSGGHGLRQTAWAGTLCRLGKRAAHGQDR